MAATATTVTETLPKVLSVYGTGGFPKMPDKNNDNKYRFYHCLVTQNKMECKRVTSPHYLPIGDNTQLLFVNDWMPTFLDKYLLKRMYTSNISVIIQK